MRHVPFGRSIVVLQLIAALVFVGYTASKKGITLPLISDGPYEVDVLLPDAEGLLASKGPAVGIAGVPAGRVTQVRVDGGQARVTLRIDAEFEDRIFKDATVTVRPTSALQTLLVDVAPGTPAAGTVEPGDTIAAARTRTFVHIDELTSVLDVDTQAQIQVLIRELAGALDGREPELRRVFAELGRTTDSAVPLARALDDRRVLLQRLVDNLDAVFTTLGERGDQLAAAVTLGNRTLEVTADRAGEIEAALPDVAAAIVEARTALAAARRLATPLRPALEQLEPVARDTGPLASALRDALPDLDRFVDAAEPLIADGRRPARLLAGGLTDQAELIRNDQLPALRELIGLVELLERNRNGVIQFAENISGLTSVVRRAGAAAQFSIMNFETSPEAFGLDALAARSVEGRPSRLSRLLAEMLERTCRGGEPAACVARFQVPGLPRAPILRSQIQGGEG